VWYITGNYGHEEAIQLADQVKTKLNFNSCLVPSLPLARTVKLEPKTSYLLELPLEDETNENNCAVTYYQVGQMGDTLKLKLVNAIVMRYLDEPFFDNLRTK